MRHLLPVVGAAALVLAACGGGGGSDTAAPARSEAAEALDFEVATEDEQQDTGVRPDLIRLSVGLESIEDILADLDGFRAAKASA